MLHETDIEPFLVYFTVGRMIIIPNSWGGSTHGHLQSGFELPSESSWNPPPQWWDYQRRLMKIQDHTVTLPVGRHVQHPR